MKAMILAAGFGKRMRPITDSLPKPLVKINDKALIEYQILSLKKAGITDIVINVCYYAEQIMRYLGDGKKYGVTLSYAYEDNGPYGTGGGIVNALPLLGEQPFLLVSADIFTEYDYSKLTNLSIKDAHIVMVENPSYHLNGDYGLSADHEINFGAPKYTYANIAVLNPKIFSNPPQQNFPLSILFEKAIDDKTITGECYQGLWFNVGSVDELQKLQQTIS